MSESPNRSNRPAQNSRADDSVRRDTGVTRLIAM